MAVFVQDNLRRIGVRMGINILDNSVVRDRVEAKQRDLSAALFQLGCYPEHLEDWLGRSSFIDYRNLEIYPLLDQLVDVVNPEEVDLIYCRLAEILSKGLPVTFLMPRVVTFIAHRRLRGLSSPFRAIPSWFMEDLWIEEKTRLILFIFNQ